MATRKTKPAPKPQDRVRAPIKKVIGELKSWLPNYDHGPNSYPTVLFRLLASLPGGDELEDVGYEPLSNSIGWHEADQLQRVIAAIQDKRDVEDIARALLSDEEEEDLSESRRAASGGHVTVSGVQLSVEAAEVAEQAGVNPAKDVARLRGRQVTEAQLLAECLDGVEDRATERAWRAYVDDVAAAAGGGRRALHAQESESPMVEFELESAVGPRVMVWGDVSIEEVEAMCPEGWEVDWETTPANLSSQRNGKRGYSYPLRRKSRTRGGALRRRR
jgi:hypothetical protein